MLQKDYNCACWLKCNYNWISTASFPNEYWKGLYFCVKCDKEYETRIKVKPLEECGAMMEIKYDQKATHSKVTKSERLVGVDRQALLNKLHAKGTAAVKDEHIIFNNENSSEPPKVTSSNVMYVAKSKAKKTEPFTNYIFEDSLIAKNILNDIYPETGESVIKGFIQEIRMYNYGILCYCEEQVGYVILYSYYFVIFTL